MPVQDNMSLQSYKGGMYTPEEITLKQYFERQRAEKQISEEKHRSLQAQRAQRMQDIGSSKSSILEGSRAALLSVTHEEEPSLVHAQSISSISEKKLDDEDVQDPAWKKAKSRGITFRQGKLLTYKHYHYKRLFYCVIVIVVIIIIVVVVVREPEDSDSYLDPNLFPPENIIMSTPWNPREQPESPLEIILDNFSFDDKQTLALKLSVPSDADQYIINIIPVACTDSSDIFYHFNPRVYKHNSLVLNDRSSDWGIAVLVDLKNLPQLFNATYELVIQIRSEGR